MKKTIQTVNENGTYFEKDIDSRERFVSYYNQYNLILKENPSSILEIGVGNKTLSTYLRNMKFNVTTCDFDKKLKPDVVADVRKLPFSDNSFDCVVAFEILEHIPYSDLKTALDEIYRVAKKSVVISIPYATFNVSGSVKLIPFVRPFTFVFRLRVFAMSKHKFDGGHYWEMGKKDYSRNRVRNTIGSTGLKIIKEYSDSLNPNHYFFVLRK